MSFLCFNGPFDISTRTQIRHKYDIEGSILTDTLLSVCCGACAIAQENAEVTARYQKVNDAPK